MVLAEYGLFLADDTNIVCVQQTITRVSEMMYRHMHSLDSQARQGLRSTDICLAFSCRNSNMLQTYRRERARPLIMSLSVCPSFQVCIRRVGGHREWRICKRQLGELNEDKTSPSGFSKPFAGRFPRRGPTAKTSLIYAQHSRDIYRQPNPYLQAPL